jgi:hypothetical protein
MRLYPVLSFYASGGTGIGSVVRIRGRRQIYGGMIVCRLAELRGKSFVERGMQFQDIPSDSRRSQNNLVSPFYRAAK